MSAALAAALAAVAASAAVVLAAAAARLLRRRRCDARAKVSFFTSLFCVRLACPDERFVVLPFERRSFAARLLTAGK